MFEEVGLVSHLLEGLSSLSGEKLDSESIPKGRLLRDKDFLYLEVTGMTPDWRYILFSVSCGLRAPLAQCVDNASET